MAREPKSGGIRWKIWLHAGIWSVVCVSTAVAARRVQRFAVTDARFTLQAARWSGDTSGISVEGVVYAPRDRIMRVFAGDIGKSVFEMPLAERRRRLLAIDWIEDAVVSRIWPNKIRIQVFERKPVAFVNIPLEGSRSTRVWLIDAQGVLLEQPPRSRFTFPVLSGVSPDQSEGERRYRVQSMLHLMQDLGTSGKDVSEVNVAAPDNLTVVANVGGRAVELMLGDANYGKRYRSFLNHYAEIRKRSATAKAFDLRLEDRITAREQSE